MYGFALAGCQKDYWLEIIIGICVGVLLLGILALVIWKVVVTAHDKRELAKFENETKKAKWNSVSLRVSSLVCLC